MHSRNEDSGASCIHVMTVAKSSHAFYCSTPLIMHPSILSVGGHKMQKLCRSVQGRRPIVHHAQQKVIPYGLLWLSISFHCRVLSTACVLQFRKCNNRCDPENTICEHSASPSWRQRPLTYSPRCG